MRIDPQPGAVYVGAGGSFRGEQAGVKPVPQDMQPDVRAIYVGGCIESGLGTLNGYADAHAHVDRKDRFQGWVCFQHPDNVNDRALRMHELAHMRTGQGHTDAWRAEMTRLGQPIPDRYKRRTRKATKRS